MTVFTNLFYISLYFVVLYIDHPESSFRFACFCLCLTLCFILVHATINNVTKTLPYFGKRKQVTYNLNLSYWCFRIVPSVFFFQAKFYASTLILLRDMLGKTLWLFHWHQWKWQTNFALWQEMFCHLLPFAAKGQNCPLYNQLYCLYDWS